MKKRILSALLATAMVVSSCLPVFAEGGETGTSTDSDVVIVSEEETASKGETEKTVCKICSAENCEMEHIQCEICEEYGCDTEHVLCEICEAYDCEVKHVQCSVCEKYDCTEIHQTETSNAPVCPGNETCTIEDCENHQITDTEESTPTCTCPDTEGVDKTAADYVHIEGCVLYVDEKDEEEQSLTVPQVGDKIWIKSGSNVYKTQSNENGHQLLLNYEVEIVNIITDENGNTVWYEFEFTTAGIGEWLIGEYKYVQAENTSVEEPEPSEPADENACNCGENAPENIADHADSCPRKQYVKSLFENKTAEEIYAQWENYDEALRTDLLNMLQKWDSEKYEELNKLVNGTPDGEIEPGDAEAIMDGLDTLKSELETLSDEGCDAFFEEMLNVYSKAFHNNYPLVSTEELIEIDAEFDVLEEQLLNEFGYIGIGNSAVLPMATFSFRSGAGTSGSSESESGVTVNKCVSDGKEDVSEFLLTMEAYVTGQVSQIEITQPSDIVLVLDQSASMYTPMGATKGYYDNTVTDADALDNPSNAKAIGLIDIDENKAAQLGYYIAHSNTPSHQYCSACGGDSKLDNDSDCTNKLYDWFVIHYDTTVSKWKFYRVAYTSCPINDTDAWSGSYNEPAMSVVEGNLAADSLKSLGINQYTVYQTQYGALYDAINAFVDSMSDMHRVAVVGFASSHGKADGSELTIGNQRGHGGTGIYVDGTFQPAYNENDNYSAAALNAFYYSALTKGKDEILQNVNAVKTDYYGTNHDLGVELANKILENAPDYEVNSNVVDTNKVIILFTDGVPSGDDNNAIKANTINYAKYAKAVDEGLGATVYSIWTSTLTGDNYGFLQSASSDNGAIAEPKYAIKVESADALSAAFQAAMQDTSSATITLEEKTVLKDVLTQYFILPDKLINKLGNQTEEELQNTLKQYIKVYTADYNGDDTWDDPVAYEDAVITLEKDSTGAYRTIKVTNFDYSANFVADLVRAETAGGEANFYGRKLIVEIPIDPNPDFVGGDGVVTNTTESGIYTEGGNLVKMFRVPDVDVEVLKITPLFQSQDIYISQMANLATILNLGIFEGTDGESYIIDGINNAYANIVYTIEDPTGFKLTYTIPAGTAYDDMTNLGWSYHEDVGSIAPLLMEDTVYVATCTVTSINDTSHTKCDRSQQTVRVFKPVITFRDSAIELGNTPNYNDNFVSVVWKHNDEEANKEIMGEPPVLEYGYSPKAAVFTELNTPVIVTVTAKTNYQNIPIDQNITQYATFYRDACDFADCTHKNLAEVEHLYVDDDDGKIKIKDSYTNFVVHLKNFDLTITKSGADSRDENQSFLFRVTGPNNFSMDVVIVGNGSVTIKNLPAGVYTVEELTDWSWRYKEQDSQTASAAAADEEGVTHVEFKNERTDPFWLSGDNIATNIFNALPANKSNEQ